MRKGTEATRLSARVLTFPHRAASHRRQHHRDGPSQGSNGEGYAYLVIGGIQVISEEDVEEAGSYAESDPDEQA